MNPASKDAGGRNKSPEILKLHFGDMSTLSHLHRPKSRKEILDELILGSLRQSHAQQLEVFRCRPLSDIVGKTKITRETDLKVLTGKPVKPPVIQTLHPQCDDRLNLVTFRAQSGNELSRQVLIQQDFHVG